MKLLPSFLAVSVAANVTLLVVFATTRSVRFPSVADAPKRANPVEPRPTPLPPWPQMDSANLDELAGHLKDAGFSRKEIYAIMNQKIADKYPRSSPDWAAIPYWRNGNGDFTDPKARRDSMARLVEDQELFRKYLNTPEYFADNPDEIESIRMHYGNFSVEKLQALRRIEADYQLLSIKQEAARTNRPDGPTNDADREAYELFEREKKADIEKLLTPEEYTAYELRNSPTAQSLRIRLEAFKPTEEEYKALFVIKKTFDEKLQDKTLTPDDRGAIIEQMSVQTAAAIGPDRAADYLESQRGMDKTSRLISRLDLPARTNAVVRNLQQDVTQRAAAIRADPQLSAADRAAQMAALAQTTRAQLTATLGEQGFEAYNDMKGEWIRALQPK